MANLSKRVDVENLLSLGEDLVAVLGNRRDGDGLVQLLDREETVLSSSRADSNDLQSLLAEYKNKIEACKERINMEKSETMDDTELEQLQLELEEKFRSENILRQELRMISDELGDLERQRISIEERKEIIKKREKDTLRARDLLSMCASVTNIIPDLNNQAQISGSVLDGKMKKVERFEFEPTVSQFEACNRLWKMAS